MVISFAILSHRSTLIPNQWVLSPGYSVDHAAEAGCHSTKLIGMVWCMVSIGGVLTDWSVEAFGWDGMLLVQRGRPQS